MINGSSWYHQTLLMLLLVDLELMTGVPFLVCPHEWMKMDGWICLLSIAHTNSLGVTQEVECQRCMEKYYEFSNSMAMILDW